LKTNFKITKTNESNPNEKTTKIVQEQKRKLTKSEFEEFLSKSGAIGSFMVFRSSKKEDELGLDQL